ncbi:MAG: S41 family peptidase [Candidatus Taylorbacteria bacterium]|nr:S41 family peptidase [Candidatus Taylorbacteria bacterium]
MNTSHEKITAKVIVVAALLLMSFGIGTYVGNQSASSKSSNLPAISGLNTLTEAQFAPFWKAWKILDDKFVGTSTDAQTKVWGAIKGLAASNGDPYTVFFPPEESKLFEGDIAGNFEGVGMEIGIKDNILTVVSPIKGSPAERAGVRSGDKILSIDGQTTNDLGVDRAVKLIRGKKGTKVKISFAREGTAGVVDKEITRDVIDVPTVETQLKSGSGDSSDGTASSTVGLRKDGIFVIKLFSFTEKSPNLFRGALRDFIASGSHKMILDLRGNPGGYLEAAQDIASWFLPVGKIIVTEDFGAKQSPIVFRSKGYDIFNHDRFKMIILVNGGSASASEILAGALREHGIAQLVGTKTFGKGSVQELIKLTSDTSLKVTVARWLTPDGHNLSHDGLNPDVKVEITQKDLDAKKDPQFDKAVEILRALP